MVHVLGWAVVGLLLGAAAWLLPPRLPPMRLHGMLLLSVGGALFGGFVSWILWDFPDTVITVHDLITIPALVSDCLAACGALVAISLATGVVLFEILNDGRQRRRR